jgi:hypothetical protein
MINFTSIFEERNSLVIIGSNSLSQNIKLLKTILAIENSFSRIKFYLDDEVYSLFSLFKNDIICQKFDFQKIPPNSIVLNFSKKIHDSIFKKIKNSLYLSPFGGNFEIKKSNNNILNDLINFLKIEKKSIDKINVELPEKTNTEKYEIIIYLKKIALSPFFDKKLLTIQRNMKGKILFSLKRLFKLNNEGLNVSKKNVRELFILALTADLFISDDLDFLLFLQSFGLNVQSTFRSDLFTYCNLNDMVKQ